MPRELDGLNAYRHILAYADKKKDGFWHHICPEDGEIWVGEKEACSWCGATEHGAWDEIVEEERHITGR